MAHDMWGSKSFPHDLGPHGWVLTKPNYWNSKPLLQVQLQQVTNSISFYISTKLLVLHGANAG